MKIKIIFIGLFSILTFSVLAQNQSIDTVRIQRLDSDIRLFIKDLSCFIVKVNSTENIDTINLLANKINRSSITLIDSINSLFKIDNSDDEIDAGMYYGLSAAFSQSFPSLSAVYLSMASSTIMNGDNSPKYYSKLKEIRDITYRLSKKKKLIKLKKLISKLQSLYKELKSLE